MARLRQLLICYFVISFGLGNPVWALGPKFAYVANSGSNTISGYSIDPSAGNLTPLGDTALGAQRRWPIAVAVDASNTFLYALHSRSGLLPPPAIVSAFRIETNGSLTFLAAADVGISGVAMTLASISTGQFVYTASFDDMALGSGGGSLSMNQVQADGTLASIGSIDLPSGLIPRSLAVAITPSFHAFLYVGCKGDDKNLLVYRINPDGTLTRLFHGSPYPADQRSWDIAVHPSGNFVYVSNAKCIDELDGSCTPAGRGTVSGFRRDPATGKLTQLPGSPWVTDYGTRLLTLHPNGQFLYTANFGNRFSPPTGSISGFYIDTNTGVLTPLPGFPLPSSRHPWGIRMHPTRNFLYVSNIEQAYTTMGTLSGFAVDPDTGALTELTSQGSPWAVEWTPKTLGLYPTGDFLYVSNDGNRMILPSSISGFRVNLDMGGLTPLAGSPFPSGFNPRTPAIDALGHHLYVPNDNVAAEEADPTSFSDISVYAINPATGVITEISNSPFLTGGSPDCVAVHPTGSFVYGVADAHNRAWGYVRNMGTGAIAPVPSNPFRTGREPQSIAIDPTGTHAYVSNSNQHGFPPDGSVSAYLIDQVTGVLTEIDPAASAGYDPISMSADFSGSYLYVADRGSDAAPVVSGNIFAYTIDDQLGFPTLIQTIPRSDPDPKPSVVTTHPSRAFAYIAFDPQFGSGSAQAYAIAADGTLSVRGSSAPLQLHPSSAAVEVSGKFLYLTNMGSNSTSQCLIDQVDGSLSANGLVATGPAPQSIATSAGN